MVTTYGDLRDTSFVMKDETDGHIIATTYIPQAAFSRNWRPNFRVGGDVITLPGGSTFRKATGWYRENLKIVPQSPQVWEGQDIAPPHHKVSIKTSPGGVAVHEGFITYDVLGAFSSSLGCFNGNMTPVIPQGMRNEAVTKALLKIADQKVNLGENLATAGQTYRMFAGATHKLVGALASAYRNRSLRPWLSQSLLQARKNGIPKTVAETYLEYIYGWKPLMDDVYALYKLAQTSTGKTLLLHAKGVSKQNGQRGSRFVNYSSIAAATIQHYVAEEAQVNCHIWARLDPNWAGARAMNQLGLLNPASLLWEITPWSFVVDWALPIGSVLAALSAPAGLIFVDGTVGMRIKARGPFEHWNYYHESGRTWSNKSNATGTIVYDGYLRETLNGWPIPGLWSDSDPLRGDRVFKALALAIANLGGMRHSIR